MPLQEMCSNVLGVYLLHPDFPHHHHIVSLQCPLLNCPCTFLTCPAAKGHNISVMLSSLAFYNEYHGHRLQDLEVLIKHLRSQNSSLIFLAGDSSLDNKHWFQDSAKAVNGYENILDRPRSRKDIAYWMNFELVQRGFRGSIATINCAIEESALCDRLGSRLLDQDAFVRNHITRDDVLVVSVGGNDIALKPSPCTICNILSLVYCSTTSCIKHCSCGTALPCDECTNGCCCSCCSNLLGWPCGFGYFVHLFRTRTEAFVAKLLAQTQPRMVVICMIYYLDMKPSNSWAEPALRGLQYNSSPDKLKTIISRIFEVATSQISIPGVKVVALPLFRCLDGSDTLDYIERVEPSASGGAKMGSFIVDAVLEQLLPAQRAECGT